MAHSMSSAASGVSPLLKEDADFTGTPLPAHLVTPETDGPEAAMTPPPTVTLSRPTTVADVAHQPTGPLLERMNRSIDVDQRLAHHDLTASIAHVQMLGKQTLLSATEVEALTLSLNAIRQELKQGTLAIHPNTLNVHTWIEQELTRRLGDIGKKVHTGRSRNDQVNLAMRLYTRDALTDVEASLLRLMDALTLQTEGRKQLWMPGYTHLQRAMPVTFATHLQAYVAMFRRDIDRLRDCRERVSWSPLGACAMAGSTLPLDRAYVASLLGLNGVLTNTIDAVASRDYVLESLACFAILMTHLSRLAEELVLWSSQEFGFVQLSRAYASGSSMMPQKRNPEVPELIRGKTGRVVGDLVGLLTVMKGLPLAYNKDMQEDKPLFFDALDTTRDCLEAMAGCVETMQINEQRLQDAARVGHLNATWLVEYLVAKGLPTQDAYRLVADVVALAEERGCPLEALALDDYQRLSPMFEATLYDALSLPTPAGA